MSFIANQSLDIFCVLVQRTRELAHDRCVHGLGTMRQEFDEHERILLTGIAADEFPSEADF